VDKSNIIQGNKGQRGLQVGDRVVAIDGVRLGSKFVAQALFSKVRSIVASSKTKNEKSKSNVCVAGSLLESPLYGGRK
jgi:hypothetical protein